MTADETIGQQLDALEAMKANWQRLMEMLHSPNPSGRMCGDGQWETTEQAIARVQGWIDREDFTIKQISAFRTNLA